MPFGYQRRPNPLRRQKTAAQTPSASHDSGDPIESTRKVVVILPPVTCNQQKPPRQVEMQDLFGGSFEVRLNMLAL